METVQPIRERSQIEAMKKILLSTNLRDYCLFVVGINSALRISDLLRLKIEDVRDENGEIQDRVAVREMKTGKSKVFPINSSAVKAIQKYLAQRVNVDKADPLFPSRKGKGKQPLQRAQAWKVLNDAARAIGIKDRIGTHTMRKTFGYHAYLQGKDITMVQKLLNHHSQGQTLAYIGITQDDMDNVYLSVNL